MPAIFFGHGSPMNAIEENTYTKTWTQFGQDFPRPKAILMVSAHWMTHGIAVTAMEKPKTIHDFGGFPQALFDMQYPAPGSPALARRVAELLAPLPVQQNQDWGLDHGTWSVLTKTYPLADIPVVQLSLDLSQPASWHFDIGKKLACLRDEGIMLMASGNVVHNLRRMSADPAGHAWAHRFNDKMRAALLSADWDKVVHYEQFGQDAALSVPTNEHFLPLLYVIGSHQPEDQLSIASDGIELGAISMMSVVLS
ncbi:MAG: 4,5-DOPA dioxygenase extradiol [Burkholderiales bacterium]|nr:4,5-DOPA dioxygenase extradiol [Burkholderiales bacterium]